MTRPFDGIRVIDATHVLAGPFATYQLGVLGADVIRVERLGGDPDQSRMQGADAELNRRNMGTYFLAQGSNKRSIALDLKQRGAQEILSRLCKTADVFVQNYRPGAYDSLGLGYEVLSEINPRLVYCSISAFGQDGPRREETGYDNIFQAASGLMAMTGTPSVSPLKTGSPVIDYGTGYAAAFAISSALLQRERTGRGQFIDLSMLDASLMLMSVHVTAYSVTGKEAGPTGNTYHFASIGLYPTSDGQIMIGASNLRQQKRLWECIGHPEMAKTSTAQRIADYDREEAVLKEAFSKRTTDEWEKILVAQSIPATRIRTLSEAMADPQLATRSVFHRHERLPHEDRHYDVPMSAFKFAHGGPSIETPPPELGSDTDAILQELGFAGGEISALRDAKVI